MVRQIGTGADAQFPHPQPVVAGEPVSPRTIATLRELLAGVTREGGTAKVAALPGYPVAGKTGTAQKAVPGRGYLPDEFIASFVGFAPLSRPALVGLVVIDDPRGSYHGSEAAAPIWAAVARQALLYLNVRPERERPELWPFERDPDAEPEVPGGSAVASAEAPAAGTQLAEAAAEAPAAAIPAGGLPDLTGRTAREAVVATTALNLAPVLRGSGVVRRQQPPPGSPLPPPGSRVELWLDPRGAG